MQETAERRRKMLKILCRRRSETVHNLAFELGVSERTIRRDVEVLSLEEPIYTQSGRYGGGVYVQEGYSMDRMYMAPEELRVLQKISDIADRQALCRLNAEEKKILHTIISVYTKPTTGKGG